jgi:hypothetical protein
VVKAAPVAVAAAQPEPVPASVVAPPPGPAPAEVATAEAAPASPAKALPEPFNEQAVREAAYYIFERSGWVEGREVENWLQAEWEISQLGGADGPKDDTPIG